MRVIVVENQDEAARLAANRIAEVVGRARAEGRAAVLGLATGATPGGTYDELVRRQRAGELDLDGVRSFNLDEYLGLGPADAGSFYTWMRRALFDRLAPARLDFALPDGTVPRERVADHCADYEARIAAAGGIDLQLLGIGRSGHIGFNEPGAARDSRTRLVSLDATTRADNAAYFDTPEEVPASAITMGVGTILDARELLLMAFGASKAEVVRAALEGPIGADVPASFLREHPEATFLLDREAAGALNGRPDAP